MAQLYLKFGTSDVIKEEEEQMTISSMLCPTPSGERRNVMSRNRELSVVSQSENSYNFDNI